LEIDSVPFGPNILVDARHRNLYKKGISSEIDRIKEISVPRTRKIFLERPANIATKEKGRSV
jgi:hypothetical protein